MSQPQVWRPTEGWAIAADALVAVYVGEVQQRQGPDPDQLPDGVVMPADQAVHFLHFRWPVLALVRGRPEPLHVLDAPSIEEARRHVEMAGFAMERVDSPCPF